MQAAHDIAASHRGKSWDSCKLALNEFRSRMSCIGGHQDLMPYSSDLDSEAIEPDVASTDDEDYYDDY